MATKTLKVEISAALHDKLDRAVREEGGRWRAKREGAYKRYRVLGRFLSSRCWPKYSWHRSAVDMLEQTIQYRR